MSDIALFDQEKKTPHEYAALSFNDFNLFQILRWGIMYMYVVWGVRIYDGFNSVTNCFGINFVFIREVFVFYNLSNYHYHNSREFFFNFFFNHFILGF